MWCRRIIILFIAIVSSCSFVSAQKVALKTNLLMDATASVNLGIEFKAGERTTIHIPGSLNAWDFSSDRKFKHIAVQPSFRWWTCQPFSGHFFGVHGHYANYNVGGIGPVSKLKDHRYEGWLAGGGVDYGYNWILSDRWSLEGTVGAGYAYLSYDKYPCGKCQPASDHKNKHYFGITKLGLSLVFLIK